MSYSISKKYLLYNITKSNISTLIHWRSFTELPDSMLVGLGNPLLDITATVDANYLQKYDLKANDAILAEERHLPIYAELIDKFQPVKYTAGGSVTNALRVFAWMVQRPNTVSFYGCVGKDNYAEIMEREARASGVDTRFEHTTVAPTGTCAALITGTSRSFVANLGAASYFTDAHLLKPDNQKLLDCAKFFYIEGFFLAVSIPSIMIIAHKAVENNSVLIFNLSALYLTSAFHKPLVEAMKYVDMLFGNADEYRSFAKEHGWKTEDLREISRQLIAMEKVNKKRSRIIVITNDLYPVIVAQADCIKEYNIPKLDKIVDSTGAGDAFAGGFISQYVQCQPIDICVRGGLYASSHVLQHVGCTLEGKPDFSQKQTGCYSSPWKQ